MSTCFGAFGKMPALGDFFRIELPPGFVEPWDRWLQDCMPTARRTLGARWQDSYFSAPIWRFTLSPGMCGAAAMSGVMMMSVDRVGRQFPLTFAAALPDGADPALDHLLSADVFAALETVALDALDDNMTREVLGDRLGRIAPSSAMQPRAGLRREPGGAVIHGTGDLMPQIAAEALRAIARRPSYWSADVAGETRMMVCEGLPSGGQLLGLFDLGARVWTGEDPTDDDLPDPVAVPEPSPDRATAPRNVPAAAATAPFVPMEDPLADILLPDEPAMPSTIPEGEDPLADILWGEEPAFEDGLVTTSEATLSKET